MKQQKSSKRYHSMSQWKESLFTEMVKEKQYEELKKDAGQLGIRLANESFDKVIGKAKQT